MTYRAIPKRAGSLLPPPNLPEYARARREFNWDDERTTLTTPNGGLNIGVAAVDRHAIGNASSKTAIRWLGEDGGRREFSYRDLYLQSNRFGNVLRSLGIERGDRVFFLTERIPEFYTALLGSLKAGCVSSSLFSAFGPDPVATRIEIGQGKVLVTTEDHYLSKVKNIRDRLPLKAVLLIGEDGPTDIPGTLDFHTLVAGASDQFSPAATLREDPALLHFTSGTTGKPKGAVHCHDAVVGHVATGRLVLDLHKDDIFWCTADPGWVTGISYGVVAPLANGVTMIVDQGEFDVERWYEIVQNERVSVWYTAPTAIRMMMKAGRERARAYDLTSLRLIFSVGEPLNAEAVVWGENAFGLPIHDTWWQTETGAIMISNFASEEIRPGSMGLAVPGIDAAIVHRVNGGIEVVKTPGEEGEIAIKKGWPSMFRGYLNDDARYREAFAGDYYLTGDLARRDEDGYFWFVGRADDVIKSSGHLIGPFEVESALMEHPAVAEAGVIGKPDPVAGQLVKAFVSLRSGFTASVELQEEIYAFGRKRLGAVAPREITIMDNLPKTKSGKIMRRLLKARELGLAEGDTSTLEAGK